ncbi:MAG: GNAT family N-acetyltransferase [Anaerolineales bacterium]|jgi:CelD/BcsL family acetyltransferase involved in cellulose biosynthesis|nr:GNAT family N-acetyltransferase [Anaerolineales bacterium]
MANIRIEIIRTLPAFEALAKEWNDLLLHGASNVPFLRHEYLVSWWQTLGGGEWQQAELYIVTGRTPDGQLAGIAPLFFAPNRQGEPALLLLGSVEISDYLDLIVSAELPADFIAALAEHLASPLAPPWKVLDWYNLLESSATLPGLERAAAQHGWSFNHELLQHCPYIPLPGDFEKYLAEQVDKKQRHEIRRKMRRAAENPTPVRWYIVEDESALEDEIQAFLSLMANDPEKEAFLTAPMRTQMRLCMQAAFRAGWLQLSFLEVNSEKAAGYLIFDHHGHLWVYNSGLDFRFRELSPGWVLLGYLLEWANQNGRQYFDFMRGNEDYKYKFGAIDRRVVRAIVQR